MSEDPRCCGSGMCIIDAEGRCWCGQRWNGQQMCAEPWVAPVPPATEAEIEPHGSRQTD